MTTVSKLDAALTYASWGWRVLPVIPNDKRPATAHGVNDATSDQEQIRKWWSANPEFNIGIAAGEASGIVVFDIDPRNGGDDSWDEFIKEHGDTPDGAYQLTAGGGQHYIANWQDGIKSCELRPGVDLLANGRYFLASPSSINGKSYEWEASSDPFDGVAPFTIPEPWRAAMAVRKVISNASESGLITGNRNAGLTAIAGSMRHYGLSEHEIHAALMVANATRCEIPLPASEVAQIAHSVARYAPESDVAADMALGAEAAEGLFPVAKINHPLNQFIDYDLNNIPATEFVLDGIISSGVVLIAGSAGVGKTTQIVPLMMRAAHLCHADDPLKPLLRRKVIYISEDPHQVLKIIRSMREANDLGGAHPSEVSDWFKVVSAERLAPDMVALVANLYSELAVDNVNKDTGFVYRTNPVVVIDTINATIDLKNESDNSEVGKAMATLKQRFKGIPMIAVGHIAKALKRADVADFSSRGAGAWEADANQVIYLTKEDDGKRWLEIGSSKHRFVSSVDGIEFEASINYIESEDVLGNKINEVLVHGVPEMIGKGGKQERKREMREDKKMGEQAAKDMMLQLKKDSLLEALEQLDESEYMTKAELKDLLAMKGEESIKVIDTMVSDGMIQCINHPFPEPIERRHQNHRQGYILGEKA